MTVILMTVIFNTLNAQSKVGKVVTEDAIPIVGVSVYSKDTKVAETDFDGKFILPDTLKLPIELRFEAQYYHRKTIEMTENNQLFSLLSILQLEHLGEVIVSSDYQKSSKVIIPTDKITAERFDAYSPIDLVSAINETPGVFIQSGALNTIRITIRGVGSRTLYGTNKIRAYFNGIPITNGVGETTIDIYDPEDLQSIEIVKGPKATQYGTNLGGTLLLNSKKTAIGDSFFKSNLTVGAYGLIKNTVTTEIAKEKFSLNLNYDHLESDGFRENNEYNRKTLLLTSAYKFNANNEISLLINYVDYFAQIPSSIGKSAFEEDPSQAAFTWKQAQGYEDNNQLLTGVTFTHRFSENFSNTSSIFYTYLDHYEPRPFNILDEYTNSYGARTVFAKVFIFLNNKANLSFGGEFYKDQYNWKTIENLYEENNGNGSLEGNLLSDNAEQRENLNVFATVTIPFTEKFTGQFGLNFNKTNYRFTDAFNPLETNKSAEREFNPIVAPNVNLLYEFTENSSAFFNFSRGFNYPSIEETLTPEGVINPQLGPEKGYNYEVGSELYLFKRKLRVQVNAYLLDVDDLLVAQRVGDDEYIGRNAGKTEHKGVELQLSYLLFINTTTSISPYLNAEITDHKFIDFIDGEQDFSGNQLTGIPDKKMSGGINISYKNFVLNTNFIHIGSIPLNDANELYSNKYSVFNTTVTFKKDFSAALSISLNAGINNFTDQKYASSVLINATGFGNSEPRFYYPGLPRNWFGGIRLHYWL